MPCNSAEDVTCGVLCLPQCNAEAPCAKGFCREIAAVDGGIASVCDVSLPDGADCGNSDSCICGSCVNGHCGGELAENGVLCSDASFRKQNQPINGVCRRTALIGDPCSVTGDCPVGICRGTVCASGS